MSTLSEARGQRWAWEPVYMTHYWLLENNFDRMVEHLRHEINRFGLRAEGLQINLDGTVSSGLSAGNTNVTYYVCSRVVNGSWTSLMSNRIIMLSIIERV